MKGTKRQTNMTFLFRSHSKYWTQNNSCKYKGQISWTVIDLWFAVISVCRQFVVHGLRLGDINTVGNQAWQAGI